MSVISDSVTDVSPAFQVKKLKSLSLFCSKAKVAGDFIKFERLEEVALSWRPVYKSVFALDTLTKLIVFGYPEKDLTGWKRNDSLKELMPTSRRLESLSGIQQFPIITHLNLFRCPKLKSLAPIASAVSIQKLALDSCRGITDLSPVSKLSDLRELQIENCGEIESLAPVVKCKKLEFLQIAGSTTVLDGNFAALMELPKLKRVLLAKRKHYSHTADELEKK